MLGFMKSSGIYFDTMPKKGSNNAVTSDGIAKAIEQGGGGGGTSDYTLLTNKPKINGVELTGNKTLASLSIASRSDLTTVEEKIEDINADIIELDDNKADKSDIPDITNLATKTELQATNDRMTQAETDIDTLETALDGKASTASVTALDSRVTQAETDIDSIESVIPSNATALNKLATMSDIGGGGIPTGIITPYGGSTPPTGWLLCQGQAVSRDEYADLFGVIGTAYGAGDGSTTFNVPDLRETVPVGSGTRGSGVATHDTYSVGTFKDDQLQQHTHYAFPDNKNGWSLYFSNISDGKTVRADSTEVNNAKPTGNVYSGRSGTTTHGKQLGVNYIIKV